MRVTSTGLPDLGLKSVTEVWRVWHVTHASRFVTEIHNMRHQWSLTALSIWQLEVLWCRWRGWWTAKVLNFTFHTMMTRWHMEYWLSKSLPLGGWWKVTPSIPSCYWYLSESKEIQKIWEHIQCFHPNNGMACVGNPLLGVAMLGAFAAPKLFTQCFEYLMTLLWGWAWALPSSASSLGSWLLSEQHPNKIKLN